LLGFVFWTYWKETGVVEEEGEGVAGLGYGRLGWGRYPG
jgi:hypothetical protein